jgi:hypothetical protein
MMDEDATTSTLGGGAFVGSVLGGVAAYFQQEGSMSALSGMPDTLKKVMSGGGESSVPDMKVGLPGF